MISAGKKPFTRKQPIKPCSVKRPRTSESARKAPDEIRWSDWIIKIHGALSATCIVDGPVTRADPQDDQFMNSLNSVSGDGPQVIAEVHATCENVSQVPRSLGK